MWHISFGRRIELAFGLVAVVTLLSFGLALQSAGQAPLPPPALSPVLEDTSIEKFDLELKTTLETQHQAQMAALESQRTTLQRLEQSVQQLLTKATPAPAPEPTKAAPPAQPEPVRRSSTIWNLNGTWDYPTEELITHLSSEHGFAAESYSREQLQTIHDNLHNGYTALGDAVVTASPAVYTYPTFQRRGGLFRGNNCAGGTCPTP